MQRINFIELPTTILGIFGMSSVFTILDQSYRLWNPHVPGQYTTSGNHNLRMHIKRKDMKLESNKSISVDIFNRIIFNVTTVVLMTVVLACSSNDDDSDGTPTPPGLAANFTVDKNAINQNETVLFSDLSEGEPSAWEWTFEGGTPATSKEKSPIITYNSKGLFSVTLKVSDGQNSHSTTKKNFIEVN